jgi:serine/threonine protein kinase
VSGEIQGEDLQTLSKNDPKSIGPFTLFARLGAGGMGVVYLATRGTQSVALKVLNASTVENPQARYRFKKEIQTLRQIDSPFVAKVIDSHADEETAWLAVEFINGPDLKALVEDRGPLPFDQWITLAHGLLSGLQAIHAEGVIHRDIKPGNILISETGPKIIDFGISQDLDATSLTTTGLMAGSPAWLSPEQIDGAKLTSATDIFSAGSVLNFAASGVSPWGNQNTSTNSVIFNNILSKSPNTSKIPEPQRGLIEALLEKEHKSRPTAPKALKLLDSFGEGAPNAQILNSGDKSKLKNSEETFKRKISRAKALPKPVGLSLRSKSIKKASVAFVVGTLLSAIVLVSPSLLNRAADFVCAETSFASGDLSNASFSQLEDTTFSNVLSRNCEPASSAQQEFSFEHCHERDSNVTSVYAKSFESVLQSRSNNLSIEIPFLQSDNRDGFARFGCRSYVQLGMMTEEESRLGSLGFSFESSVPLLSQNGPMTLGDSRYKLMFDGNSGTFVTRFYPSNQEESLVTLGQSDFPMLEIERIEYVSGYLVSSLSDLWRKTPGESRAEIVMCIDDWWDQSLVESGHITKLNAQIDGAWKPAGEVEWVVGECGATPRSVIGVLSDTTLLSMEVNGTCNPVRFDLPISPEVPIGIRDILEYCIYLKES